MIKERGKVYVFGPMEISIKDYGRIIKLLVKVKSCMLKRKEYSHNHYRIL